MKKEKENGGIENILNIDGNDDVKIMLSSSVVAELALAGEKHDRLGGISSQSIYSLSEGKRKNNDGISLPQHSDLVSTGIISSIGIVIMCGNTEKRQ